jgi:hypothetical protein
MSRIISGCLLALLLAAPVPAVEKDEAASKETDLTAMAEDIEIMQRIIDRTLREHFAGRRTPGTWFDPSGGYGVLLDGGKDDEKKRSELSYYIALGQLQLAYSNFRHFNVVGYYIPGTGVLFTLDISVPTEQVDVPEQEESKPDLWKQMEGEVRGLRTVWPSITQTEKPQKTFIVDQDELDDTVEVLIKTVGEYGSRITQLSDSESMILAIKATAQVTFFSSGRKTAESLLATTYNLYYRGSHGAPPQRVIVQVPVTAIRDFESRKIALDALKEKVVVTQYPAHASTSGTSSSWTIDQD